MEFHQSHRLLLSNFMAVTRKFLTQVVEVVVLPRELHLPYACHQFIVRFFRKGKWRILAANEEEKYRLGNEGKKNRKYKSFIKATVFSYPILWQ